MMDPTEPYAISRVDFIDTDGIKRTRMVLDIPFDKRDSFFDMWKLWHNQSKESSNDT